MPIGPALLGEVPEQARRRASRAKPRSSSTGSSRSASAAPHDAGAVQRQRPPEDLRMHPADGVEQPQVRPAQALLPAIPISTGRARVAVLVHRMAEAGDEPPGRLVCGRGPAPARPTRRRRSGRSTACRRARREEPAASSVTPRNREPPPSRPGGERALERVGRGQVGQPGGDRGRGEAVVGQRDEHRLEHPDLRRRRPSLGHQPEGQLAEADLAHQVGARGPGRAAGSRRRSRCPSDVG